MGLFSRTLQPVVSFPWIELTSSQQLKDAIEHSLNIPVLFFKHSTRCSTSSMVKSRLEKNSEFSDEKCDFYFLDLIAYRSVSNEMERLTGVVHESPQVILLKDRKVVYQASHSMIFPEEIRQILTAL